MSIIVSPNTGVNNIFIQQNEDKNNILVQTFGGDNVIISGIPPIDSGYINNIYFSGEGNQNEILIQLSGQDNLIIEGLNALDSDYLSKSETGVFYPRSNPSGFITGVDLSAYVTGDVIRPSDTGQFYPASNPSGFITGVELSGYSTISFTTGISGYLQSEISILQQNTGSYYLNSNPSGFITGVDLSNYATIPYTTGISGNLQTQINSTNQILSTAVFVTGNQDISGLKDFQTRPTVLDIPVLISGDAVDTIHLYGKNDQGITIYKGQPVYIGGANGTNALIQLASNTGERTSSKTIGLLAQDIPVNEFGYVITEGLLEGFNTSAGIAGDPMWLGPTGNIIYGTGNKPYGNNHLVSLGIVLRSNNNNGKVYVKVQNGFEIEELHKVYAINPSNKDTLLYNSGSGAWFARQLNTGDVSGINNYFLNSQTGIFYPSSNPSGFAATGISNNFTEIQYISGERIVVTDGTINKIISLSQASYNALSPNYISTTLYIIT
jgi:hypothetical protein